MVDYVSREELIDIANRKSLFEQRVTKSIAETLDPEGNTFLSHSSSDDELVVGAIELLKIHGARIYIDKKDADLPPYTNENTAAILKDRISDSSKFVLLASKNSSKSKWVPWELGLADGFGKYTNVAILPAIDSDGDSKWVSWEYLGLYHHIVRGRFKGNSEEVWMVKDPKQDRGTELSKWLKR